MAKRILITGSNGAIGRAATRALREAGHFVRGMDLVASPLADESVVGSIVDAAFVADAADEMDALIHLAATVDDADFMTELLPNNVVGLYNVLEAARLGKVRRVALASSMQVVSGVKMPAGRMLRVEDGTSPLNHYAATKIYAEAMGHLYANRYGIEVLCARIGWLPRNAREARRLLEWKAQRYYLSHDDAGRFFVKFVEAAGIAGAQAGYAVVFCVSSPPRDVGAEGDQETDTGAAERAIGYRGRDVFPAGLGFAFEEATAR